MFKFLVARRFKNSKTISIIKSSRQYSKEKECEKAVKKCVCKEKSICGPFKEQQDVIPLEGCKSCMFHRRIEFMDVRCKTAIVTGGASGIGLATVRALLKAEAANVVIADICNKVGEATAKKLNAPYQHDKVVFVPCDVTCQHQFDSVFKETIDRCEKVDILINNVGIFNETPDEWEKMYEVNTKGIVRGTLLAMEYMCQNCDPRFPSGGCIVNLSSVGTVSPYPAMPVYAASKGAINGLSSSFGSDFHFRKTNIRVLTMCPGNVNSQSLKSYRKFLFDKTWSDEAEETLRCPKKQSPDNVAKAILHIIKYGTSGSVYVSNGGKLYKYDLPDYRSMLKREAIFY